MSVITWDMITSFAAKEGIDINDGTQIPGVVGSLQTWENGQGELDANLVNGDPSFAPLVAAYNHAHAAITPPVPPAPVEPPAPAPTA